MTAPRIVYLSGGVGGARLLDGLVQAASPGSVSVVVNTGDDFDHLGLRICPDLDTVLYTLSGLGDPERGWGIAGDSFDALEMIARLGGDSWFQLGDRDLATHVVRTQRLSSGLRLTEVTARMAQALGVSTSVLPMCDRPLATRIDTEHEGTLSFQDWLVRRRGQPTVQRVRFEGDADATPEVLRAVEHADVCVIGPSNPYVSIDPILTRRGVRERLSGLPVIAVSPIVGGRAIKGPLAEMIPRLAGRPSSAEAVAAHYGDLLAGYVVERGDAVRLAGIRVLETETIMQSPQQRLQLGREVARLAETLCS